MVTIQEMRDVASWGLSRDGLAEAFDVARRQGPVFVDESVGGETKPNYYGYWALTRHADIAEASRRAEDFSSAAGPTIDDQPPIVSRRTSSLLAMDDPDHARLRRVVSRAFSPAALKRLRADVETIAAEIITGIVGKDECDFVRDVAAPFPTRVVLDLMGIPRSEEPRVLASTNTILGLGDAEYVPDQTDEGRLKARLAAMEYIEALAQGIAIDRMREPRDDVATMLVNGVEGDNMTPEEMSAFFSLLLLAGSETTRTAVAHGMLALTEFPEQRAAWESAPDDVTPTAVEEILRWASPVLHMRRTVRRDGVRIGEADLKQGDRVVMWYYAGNRDPAAFDDPHSFDVRRHPNDHFSFGAPGAHFCLGAHLARREIAVLFGEIFEQVPRIAVCGEPVWLSSNFLNGMKHLPVKIKSRR